MTATAPAGGERGDRKVGVAALLFALLFPSA